MDLVPKEVQEIRNMIQTRADRDEITFNEALKRIADEIKETSKLIDVQKDPGELLVF